MSNLAGLTRHFDAVMAEIKSPPSIEFLEHDELIEIDREQYLIVDIDSRDLYFEIETDSGEEFLVFEKKTLANQASFENYWWMRQNDMKELQCLTAPEYLIDFCVALKEISITKEYDRIEYLIKPEFEFGSYDSCEYQITGISEDVFNQLGFESIDECVVYRSN